MTCSEICGFLSLSLSFLRFQQNMGFLAFGLVTSRNFFGKTNLVFCVARLLALQTVKRMEFASHYGSSCC